MSSGQKQYFSEVCILAQLILLMPATDATSECSFFTMRGLKTHLQSTMCHSRLNHLIQLTGGAYFVIDFQFVIHQEST